MSTSTATNAREAERWDMGKRIREVEQGPDGSIYLLEDERNGSGGGRGCGRVYGLATAAGLGGAPRPPPAIP